MGVDPDRTAFDPFTTQDYTRTFLTGPFDVLEHALLLLARYQWVDRCVAVHARAHRHRRHRQGFDESIVDRAMHIETRSRGAHLAVVQQATGRGTATGHDVEHACRNAGFQRQFRQTHRGQRSVHCRFDDHRAAGGPRRHQLPGGDQQREVPRHDTDHHTHRLTIGEGGELGARWQRDRHVERLPFDLGRPAGHVAPDHTRLVRSHHAGRALGHRVANPAFIGKHLDAVALIGGAIGRQRRLGHSEGQQTDKGQTQGGEHRERP